MVSLFSAPKAPPVEEAPLPPAQDPEAGAKRDAESVKAAQRYAAGGRASQILTSPLGVAGVDGDLESKSKLLLG